MTLPRLHFVTAGLTAAILLSAAAGSALHAQESPDTVDLRGSRLSQVEYVATNTGIFGYDPVTRSAGFHYPRSSGKKYLLGSGLWFGARKGSRSQTPLVFYTYNVNTGRSEATPGECDRAYEAAAPFLYHSVEYNASGSYSEPTPVVLPPWPLWQSTPYSPASMFAPGRFEPSPYRRTANLQQGVPAFALNADEQMFARYHDNDLGRYEIDSAEAVHLGYPIGLQIEQHIYAWKGESPKEGTIVIAYDIINRSGDTLYDCVASQAAEPDIGSFANDHLSFYNARPELRSGYIWSDPETNGDYKALGMILVEGPVVGPDGMIDNASRQRFRHEGRAGAFAGWTDRAGYDPVTNIERYRLMSSGGFAGDGGPNDYRCLLATTGFAMRPGDTAHFTVAFAIIDGVPNGVSRDELTPDQLNAYYSEDLDRKAEGVIESYYTIPVPSSMVTGGERAGSAHDLKVVPSPARHRSSVELTVAGPTRLRIDVVDNIGQNVLRVEREIGRAGRYHHDLDVATLPAGTYFVTVTAEGKRSSGRLIVE